MFVFQGRSNNKEYLIGCHVSSYEEIKDAFNSGASIVQLFVPNKNHDEIKKELVTKTAFLGNFIKIFQKFINFL